MLRSWTRRLGIESDLRVGIAISKNHMDAVAINGTPGEWKTAWTKQHTIEPSLFAINTDRSIGSTFHEAMKSLVDAIKGGSCPIHVVVPDIAIRSATFELDELPKSKSTLSALARWRMSNEIGKAEDEIECKALPLGVDQGKQLLYVQAGDRYWLEQIRTAMNRYGLVPWTINSASFFRYNYLCEHVITPSSAMLSVDDDCWTLQAWDAESRIRLTVSRMRRSSQCADEIDNVINESNRVIRSWLMRSSNFKLNTLYLDGHKSYVAELAVRTDSELFDKIVIMEGGGDLVDERFHNQSSLMSLASLAAISA